MPKHNKSTKRISNDSSSASSSSNIKKEDSSQSSNKTTKRKNNSSSSASSSSNIKKEDSSQGTASNSSNIKKEDVFQISVKEETKKREAPSSLDQKSAKKKKTVCELPDIPKADTGKDITCSSQRICDILREGVLYTIPRYQRPFEWSGNDITKLLDDLILGFKKQENYFLSNIIIKETEGIRKDVTDGQQRLTSICIIVAAIRLLVKNHDEYDKLKSSISSLLESTFFNKAGHIIEIKNDSKGSKDTFFAKHIVTDSGLFDEFVIQKNNIADFIEKLEKKGIVYSQTSLQIATDMLHVLFYLHNNLLTFDNLSKLLVYIREHTVMCVTTVAKNVDEFTIFRTLNCRGKDLSVMDVLKSSFQEQFKTSPTISQSVKKWNTIFQEMNEENFSLLIEALYIVRPNSEVSTIRVSPSQRPYKNMFSELVAEVQDKEFVTSYMKPLYEAFLSLKLFETEEFDCLKDVEVISFLLETYFNKKSNMDLTKTVSMLLLAIHSAKKENTTKLFGFKLNLQNVDTKKLIKLWTQYLISLVLLRKSKIELTGILFIIRGILVGDDISDKLTLGSIDNTVTKNKICKKMEQQDNFKSKEDQELRNVFEIALKLILFNHGISCNEMTKYTIVRLITEIPLGLSVSDKNKFKKIGNYALAPKKNLENEDCMKRIVALVKKCEPLAIDETNMQEDGLEFVTDRTESIIDALKQLIGLD